MKYLTLMILAVAALAFSGCAHEDEHMHTQSTHTATTGYGK